MRVYLDAEFTGLRQNTTLISIGLVTDKSQFYAEFTDYDVAQVDEWIETHVIANLTLGEEDDGSMHYSRDDYSRDEIRGNVGDEMYVKGSREFVSEKLSLWLGALGPVEIWGDVLGYDWVLFCELFGGAFGVPDSVYYIPFDIATLMKVCGVDPDINREELAGMGVPDAKHNALWDAHVVKACHERLMEMEEEAHGES